MVYLSLLLGLTFTSCRKDNIIQSEQNCDTTYSTNHSYDIINPSDYLMAYPGSWWNYDNNSSINCVSWDSVLLYKNTNINGCVFNDEDVVIVPTLTGYYNGHIYYNSILTTDNDLKKSDFRKILDTINGQFYYNEEKDDPDNQDSYYINSSSTIEILDSISVGSSTYYNVLHVNESTQLYYYHLEGGPLISDNDLYFSKNVGLVRKISKTTNPNDTVNLVNYYIAPH